MADTMATPPTAEDEKEWKASLAVELSKMAVGRLQNRQKVEWQVNLSLWTFFILEAFAAHTHGSMGCATTMALLLLAISIAIILDIGYVYFRLNLEMRNRTDQATAYYWETCAEHFAQYRPRPDALVPRMKHYDYRNSGPISAQSTILRRYWSPITQIGITLVFSSLAPSVLVIRLAHSFLQEINPAAL